VTRTLHALEARGWVRRLDGDEWGLTPTGLAEAERQSQAGRNAAYEHSTD
jgi:hypothetical protein